MISLTYRRLGRTPPKKPTAVRQRPPNVRLFEREYAARLAAVIAAWADHVEDIMRGGRTDAKKPTKAGPLQEESTRRLKELLTDPAVRAAAVQVPGKGSLSVAEHKPGQFKFSALESAERAAKFGEGSGVGHRQRVQTIRELEALVKAPAPPALPPLAPIVRQAGALEADLTAAFDGLVQASGLARWLERTAAKIGQAQSAYTSRVFKVPPASVTTQNRIEDFRKQNLGLITKMRDDQVRQIADIIRPAQAIGQRWEEIAPQIQDRIGVTESRARLIARDQTNKFNGAMQKASQTALGIEEYAWSTSEDYAVRGRPGGEYPPGPGKENHWALRNKRFRWDSPPLIPGTSEHAHPGERIQCRCVAIPVVPFFDK